MNASENAESVAQIFDLRPLPKFTSQGDLLRYVERTRRQLDRFEKLPTGAVSAIDPQEATRIRTMCDELEADILIGLSD